MSIEVMKQAEKAIDLVFSVGFEESTRSGKKRADSVADFCAKTRLALRQAIEQDQQTDHRDFRVPAPTAPAKPTCTWTEDADGYYSTECGEAYVFNDGTPAHNNAYFCHHCGGTIVMGEPL